MRVVGWAQFLLPSSLMPIDPGKSVKYDLALIPGIELRLRGPNPVFEQGSGGGTYLGTFNCSSATPEVKGELEISGTDVVSNIKQVTYPGGGKMRFSFYLDYSGGYPVTGGSKPTHAMFRFGSLFQLAGN